VEETARWPAPGTRRPMGAGSWYYAVTVLSAGFLAALPFWHAAWKTRRPDFRIWALVYTLVDVFLVVLLVLTPRRADGTSASETISTIGGFSVILVVVLGCLHLRVVRREVYAPRPQPVADDPILARALARRARRENARELAAQDPSLARELGIGRPDLGTGYDDGGLVDLNSAPADVIARVAGIEREHADAIVTAREARGGSFFNLGEVLVDVPLPPHAQDLLRDRGLV
jgi:heme/copper-type cytochrome/quinol oxidase subunit 4